MHRGVVAGKPAELRFQFAGAADDLRTPIRQAGKSIAHALQLGVGIAEDARVVQRADRQLVLIVRPHRKIAVGAVEFESQLSRLEFNAILFAEKRNEQFGAQVGMVRLPVDVEPACVDGFLAPFEHVEPQRVVSPADANVVGDEVEDLAQAIFGEGRDHPVEIGLVAEFGVQRPVVDNIVAVGAPAPCFQIGRGIDMADPQPRKIRSDPRRIRKAEPLVKLKPVCGERNHVRPG